MKTSTLDAVLHALTERYRFAGAGKVGRHEQINFAPVGTDSWRALTDVDLIGFRCELERAGLGSVSRRRMNHAVRSLATRAPQ